MECILLVRWKREVSGKEDEVGKRLRGGYAFEGFVWVLGVE